MLRNHRTEVRGSGFLFISISALQDRLAARIALYEKETNGGCGHVYIPGSQRISVDEIPDTFPAPRRPAPPPAETPGSLSPDRGSNDKERSQFN